MLILPALILAGAVHAQLAVDWNGNQGCKAVEDLPVLALGKQNEKEDTKGKKNPDIFSSELAPDTPSLTPEQLACKPDVIEGFKKIWQMAHYGNFDDEAGLNIAFVNNHRWLVVNPSTFEHDKTQITVWQDLTVAIAHTHPNDKAGLGQPSCQDEQSPVPNFVVSHVALWVTDPKTHKSRKVRDNWAEPCVDGH
jgi:hypothetical protein